MDLVIDLKKVTQLFNSRILMRRHTRLRYLFQATFSLGILSAYALNANATVFFSEDFESFASPPTPLTSMRLTPSTFPNGNSAFNWGVYTGSSGAIRAVADTGSVFTTSNNYLEFRDTTGTWAAVGRFSSAATGIVALSSMFTILT